MHGECEFKFSKTSFYRVSTATSHMSQQNACGDRGYQCVQASALKL